MLSDFQIETLWRSWLSAEIRAAYFAELTGKYQTKQKALSVASLVLSSGAALSFITTAIPAEYIWVRPALALLSAVASIWAFVAKNERSAVDCADLHFRWNSLAMECEALWSNTATNDAVEKLAVLRKKEAEISKSSTSFPDDQRLMAVCQDNVLMHHQQELAA